MAKTVIVKLTDDIDGSDADETITFSLDGSSYEIDLSGANAKHLREAFRPFIESGRTAGNSASHAARSARVATSQVTLFSRLSDDEKLRFRSWADMATARRISDAKVEQWTAAGRP
jgi:hypothetical protein